MKKTAKVVLLFCCFLFLRNFANAQTQKLFKGIVLDTSGQPLSGATISLKGTKVETTTNDSGQFQISVADVSKEIVVSLVGYNSQFVSVSGKDSAQISLIPVQADGNAVVVTALGIARKTRGLVYATQSVKTSELTDVRDANNFVNSLSGKVANVLITQGSGGPGSGARIVLRGNRSIQQSNTALIVVDGVPMLNVTTNVPGGTFGSFQGPDGASNLNADDIESLTVLRGASAAALYGSQAGNGVLVVATKKGKTGIHVDFNSGYASESVFALPKFQNTYGQGTNAEINTSVGSSWGAKMTGQTYTNSWGNNDTYSAQDDNVKDFFRNGSSFINYVGFSGGNDKTKAYFSYTNNATQGIVPKNNLMRHNINLRVFQQFTDKLSVDARLTYIHQKINNMPRTGEENSPVFDMYQIPRSVKLSEAKNYQQENTSTGLMEPTTWPSTLNSIYQNPYWMINNTSINSERDRIMGFMSLKYDITSWLNIAGRANLDRSLDDLDQSYQDGTILWTNAGNGGNYITSSFKNTQQWYDVILSGKNELNKDWTINYNAGSIFRDYKYVYNTLNTNGLYVANKFSVAFAKALSATPQAGGDQTQSVFGTANFAYKDALFFDGSYRNDWDSRLASPYSYGYYSAGVAAVLSDLFKLPQKISYLKVNASYAEVGNGGQEQIRNVVYNYTQSAGNGEISRNSVYPIPNLKPEIVKNIEATVEAKFFNNRFGFAATYYKSNSINQLISLSTPVATGYATKYINAGNIQNSGWEFTLQATPIKNEDFNWDVAVNFSMNKSKIKKISDDISTIYLSSEARAAQVAITTGGKYGDLYGYKWATNDQGQHIVDANGLPVATTTTQYLGNFNPTALLGWTNTFTYKRFYLRVLTDGRIGGTLVSGTEMNLAFSGITEGTEKFREGGLALGGVTADGTVNTKTVTAQQFWTASSVTGQRYGTGEFFAYDATNFRLREFSFGYDIPVKSTSLIKTLKLSAVARNLFWIYRGSSRMDIPGIGKRKMWFDPDMSMGNGNYQGVEYGAMPATRTWGVNLKVGF
ncbi:SusC/RagA family TonB-linked outer membrane protein [Rhizosphaericola mali]|uniref:SusC/RagA family TonB-linked outer membrane protein n=1 Tax=Rhizosphaericola mali TaxID=2545455 RepID=A0A5P2GEH5_9BACT|nr:SusC/RagA family TonB-linked outer membrane protein [Rhizosphaericola mali]QES90011.1 SusC/RagA family TonB-linked outer membrane protein [Rhizosphaericola mali]